MVRLLVINPNSSSAVTDNLQSLLTAPPQVELVFYTAPPDAPKEIDGEETSRKSCEVCLPDLAAHYVDSMDGFLVCCYSDHPLIYELQKISPKPVLGIFQASLLYALSQSPAKALVLTSFNEWESILDESIVDFFGGVFPPLIKRTKALDISVLNLNNPEEYGKITKRVQQILNENETDPIRNILLGCAGMAGLDTKLEVDFPEVKFIDSVKIGVEFLNGMINFNRNK